MADGQIIQGVRWLRDAAGRLVGYRNPVTDKDEAIDMAAAAALVSKDGALRASSVRTRRVKRFGVMTGSTPNFTMAAIHRFPFPWLQVRPIFYNPLAADGVNITASLAVTSSAASFDPAGGTSTACTISAATPFTVPQAVSGGAASPGTPNTTIHSRTAGDWMTLPSIARTDGGSGFLLSCRYFTPTAGNVNDIRAAGFVLNTSAIDVDECVAGYFSGGDRTTTTGNAWTRYDVVPPVAFEFRSELPFKTFGLAGDSTSMGYGFGGAGPLQHNSGLQLGLRALKLQGYALDLCQTAYGSQNSPNYLTNGLNLIAENKPDFAGLQVGSVNDTDSLYSAAWADRCVRDALTWIDTCYAAGVRPFLKTMHPKNGLSAGNLAALVGLNSRTRALCEAAGIACYDPWTVLASAAGAWLTGYTDDGTHINAAGGAAEGEYARTWIAALAA